ncbi:MAG TPA: response regulator, partial [Pseudolabrys sp.]
SFFQSPITKETPVTLVGHRVLVVEDDFLVALTTIDVLESIGCEIVGPAGRLATAIQLVQSEPLDAAVLDINISGEMVWPVAEELQRRGVPFLFLTAYPQLSIVPNFFATVARLEKPLVRDRLLNHLRAMWTEHA